MADVATPLIAAGGVLAGATAAGAFALVGHLVTRKTERLRWQRESDERNRTRFHEARVDAYANFLALASNAFGWLFNQELERRKALDRTDDPPDLRQALENLRASTVPGQRREESPEHPEFNSDAARQMTRSQNVVQILASSSEVRAAADELVNAVLAASWLTPEGDRESWNAAARAVTERVGEVHRRFVDAANTELHRAGDSSS